MSVNFNTEGIRGVNQPRETGYRGLRLDRDELRRTDNDAAAAATGSKPGADRECPGGDGAGSPGTGEHLLQPTSVIPLQHMKPPNVLRLTRFPVPQDIFTNTRRLWQPPGARGVYGGSVIAQSLAAAQRTVPHDYLVHSCHCYFLLAGAATVPILFHVERVRDGRSFATRTVQARQKGRCIFTTTISFVREGSAGVKEVRHAAPLPGDAPPAPPEGPWDDEPEWGRSSPFQTRGMQLTRAGDPSAAPHERKARQWCRSRGRISDAGGHQAHLEALAYMSDNYFIGTVTRANKLWRFGVKPEDVGGLPEPQRSRVLETIERDGFGADAERWRDGGEVGMVVSLDHSIYFHEPRRVRADEWMFFDMESPWSGGGRGLVQMKVFARDGTLLATFVQEVSRYWMICFVWWWWSWSL